MAEELQSLIEKIRSEGIAAAEREGAEIVARAEARAAEIVREAEGRAARCLEEAGREEARSVERGTRAIEQAARDVVLRVGAVLGELFERVIGNSARAALEGEALGDLIRAVVRAYIGRGMGEGRVEILLSPTDHARLRDGLMAEFSGELGRGFDVVAEAGLGGGFRVWCEGERVLHDFSGEALGEALGASLRPALAEIVHRAARGVGGKGG